MKIKELISFFDQCYPFNTAAGFDHGKIGLQFGDSQASFTKGLITLDVTENAVKEAIANGCQLIISHHPLMFTPMVNLDYQSPLGRILCLIFTHKINVISLHTNYDVGIKGMNEHLATLLGLTNVLYQGIEISEASLIRYGEIEPTSLKQLANHVKTVFDQPFVKIVGNQEQVVSKIGIVGGSGDSCLNNAICLGLDVLITGEIKHHNALLAIAQNICLIEVGHAVEKAFIDQIEEVLTSQGFDATFIKSQLKQDPFDYL